MLDPPRQQISLEAILEGIGEGFMAFDAQWRVLAFNPAAERTFNLKASGSNLTLGALD